MKNKNIFLMQKAFSVVEVLLAAAIFVIFAVGISEVVVNGLNGNRLGEEQTKATQFASEGIEAVKSIKKQSFASLTNTAGTGVSPQGGLWTFAGSSDTFEKYTRVLTVSDVQRDGSGNIVASGGTVDPNTKKVTSTVSWNFNAGRSNSVVLNTYLTDFAKAIGGGNNLIIYGDGTTTPKFRTFDKTGDTFGTETSTIAGTSGLTFDLKTSPTSSEAIAGYVNSLGVLQIMCFDGTTWTNEWSTIVGGTGTTRRFDISYETNSGDVLVLYSNNTATTNELAFRTKSGSTGCGGSNWSVASNFDPVRTSGTVQWVKMAWDVRSSSNLITAIWADNNSDLSAAVWSGTSLGNEPSGVTEASLEIIASPQDIDDFDVAYESVSGDVMLVWANAAGNNGVNGVRYRTCTGGTSTCTWNAVTTPPTFNDDATNLDISSNPNSDEIVFASIGNAGNDLQIGYWSGSAWTNTANVDTSCASPLASTQFVATGWLSSGSTNRSVVVYDDQGAGNVGWYVGNGSTFSSQTDFTPSTTFNTSQRWYEIQTDPINKDQLMFTLSDNANDLFSKRLTMTSVPVFTWSNSDGGSLNLTLPQGINSPFSFAYARN